MTFGLPHGFCLFIEIYNENLRLRVEQEYQKHVQFDEDRLKNTVKTADRLHANKVTIAVSIWLPFTQDKKHDSYRERGK